MKRIQDIGISACVVLVVFLSTNSFTSANPVDKTDIEIEHVINSDNDIGEAADKRGSFSRILRSGSKEEDAYNRILRGASFSRILRSPTTSFSRILRSRPGSFSRILRGLENGGTSSFSRILRGPKSFSRIVRAKPSQFSRILRDSQDILMDEASAPRPNRAYTRILRSDPEVETFSFDEDDDDVNKRGSSGFSRILRDSFSRIL